MITNHDPNNTYQRTVSPISNYGTRTFFSRATAGVQITRSEMGVSQPIIIGAIFGAIAATALTVTFILLWRLWKRRRCKRHSVDLLEEPRARVHDVEGLLPESTLPSNDIPTFPSSALTPEKFGRARSNTQTSVDSAVSLSRGPPRRSSFSTTTHSLMASGNDPLIAGYPYQSDIPSQRRTMAPPLGSVPRKPRSSSLSSIETTYAPVPRQPRPLTLHRVGPSVLPSQLNVGLALSPVVEGKSPSTKRKQPPPPLILRAPSPKTCAATSLDPDGPLRLLATTPVTLNVPPSTRVANVTIEKLRKSRLVSMTVVVEDDDSDLGDLPPIYTPAAESSMQTKLGGRLPL